jgi:hypothetical protein
VLATRMDGTTDVTTSAAWSRTVDSGDITSTIGAATGILNITALGSSGVVTITSVHDGITKSRKVTVTKQVGDAPMTGGGGGTASQDNTFASFNSTTMATVSDELTVTVGAGGTVTLSAPLEVYTDEVGPTGTFEVFGIWQWWDGAVWVDRGTETASSPDCNVTAGPVGFPGSIAVSNVHSGLVAAASEKYRLQFRNSSGTRVMYLSGTASAVGS